METEKIPEKIEFSLVEMKIQAGLWALINPVEVKIVRFNDT